MSFAFKSFLPSCENCSAPSRDLFCDECLKVLKFKSACALCGLDNIDEQLSICIPCRARSVPWKSLSISFFYQDGVRSWIRDFKNHFRPERIRELEASMLPVLPKVDMIVSVSGDPLSCRRRLYDPAFELGKRLSQILEVPVCEGVFLRRSFLTTQKELDLPTRAKFLTNLVSLGDNAVSLQSKKLLLVDDVMTTGASLSVHAKLLLPITEDVHVFCLSRALKTS